MRYHGKLDHHELETVVDWFMYHLMADLPQEYAKLTGAAPEVIAERVLARIRSERVIQFEHAAAELDGSVRPEGAAPWNLPSREDLTRAIMSDGRGWLSSEEDAASLADHIRRELSGSTA